MEKIIYAKTVLMGYVYSGVSMQRISNILSIILMIVRLSTIKINIIVNMWTVMVDNMIYGITMARKNSSRFRNKNLQYILPGVTLFEYNLKKMVECNFNGIFVITDDPEIIKITKRLSILTPTIYIVEEPESLAKQNNSWKVIKYLIEIIIFNRKDTLVYLPCTAPLRTVFDIKAALSVYKLTHLQYDSVVSMCKCSEPPQWAFKLTDHHINLKDFPMTSQELEEYYFLNGSIYISNIHNLIKNDGFYSNRTYPFIMPRSHSIDIDDEDDLEYAHYQLTKQIATERLII